jgi:hypothetical protein
MAITLPTIGTAGWGPVLNTALSTLDTDLAATIAALAGKANASHTHVKADITDFTHTHVKANISDFAHTHPISEVTALQTALEGKISALSYTNAVTGTRYTILYNGTAWPGSRPSSRTDIYFDLIGGGTGVSDPAWMINGDAREVVV